MSTASLTAAAVTSPTDAGGLSVAGLSAGYDAALVLHDADLTVAPGTLTAVLGASGCGKSTLLRAVAGFIRPRSGTITVGGRVVAGDGTWLPPERRRVGIVPQEGALFGHLDVAGNIGFGVPRRQRAARVAELLDLIGLPGMGAARPHELSGGMQQRVALARALAPSPDVVLLDEPFSALDVSLRASVRAEVIAMLKRLGATAVLVTHDQDEALSCADQVAVMRDGRIVQAAAPRDIYERPVDAALAEFLGDCNLLPADRRGDGALTCALGTLPATVPFDDHASVAMLRPEHVQVVARSTAAAVVTDVSYHGHDLLLRVALPDGATVLSRMLAAASTPSVGDRVDLRISGT